MEPTPLLEAPNLRRDLGPGAPPLLLKMDAWTGFALGGNKVRKLEHELAPDRLEGITHVITAGGGQSNHARVTAAAAARLGLRCILVLDGSPPDPPRGNALLHRLFGAEVRPVPRREDRDPAMDEAAREVERRGGRARVIPLGASTARGALGYVRAARELHRQRPRLPRAAPIRVFVPSSSCGTLAGLLLGFAVLGRRDIRLVGVSADEPASHIVARTLELAGEAAGLLGVDFEPPGDPLLEATDSFVGAGYGASTDASEEATRLLARTEGVVLDPVYTAKAAAGMLSWIRSGRVEPAGAAVLWHTGGQPALWA